MTPPNEASTLRTLAAAAAAATTATAVGAAFLRWIDPGPGERTALPLGLGLAAGLATFARRRAAALLRSGSAPSDDERNRP